MPPFVRQEYQPGLAIEPGTGTARHGMLYFLKSLRFAQDAGLFGMLTGTLDARLSRTALESSTGSAGRKGRVVHFTGVERLHRDWEKLMEGAHLPAEVADGATFWLLTLTPVRLAGAPCLLEIHLEAPGGVRLRVRAALTGRPLTLGGYQMATGRGRPNRLYVPAGSAWLIQLEGGTAIARGELLQRLNNAHPLGPREEAALGFGHSVVGVNPETAKENL